MFKLYRKALIFEKTFFISNIDKARCRLSGLCEDNFIKLCRFFQEYYITTAHKYCNYYQANYYTFSHFSPYLMSLARRTGRR